MLPVVTITAAICYHVSNPSTVYSRATWTVRDWAPLSATFAGCRGRRLLTPLSAETTLPHRRWRRRRVDTRLPPIIIGLVCFANAPTLDKLLPCFVDVFTISYCDQSNLVDSVALCGEMNPITHLCSTTQSVNKWMYNYEQTSLRWASHVSWLRDTARICRWMPCCCSAQRPPVSIDISCPPGPQQQTRSGGMQRSMDGKDRRTDKQTEGRTP